jgi:hypothetical protein
MLINTLSLLNLLLRQFNFNFFFFFFFLVLRRL